MLTCSQLACMQLVTLFDGLTFVLVSCFAILCKAPVYLLIQASTQEVHQHRVYDLTSCVDFANFAQLYAHLHDQCTIRHGLI